MSGTWVPGARRLDLRGVSIPPPRLGLDCVPRSPLPTSSGLWGRRNPSPSSPRGSPASQGRAIVARCGWRAEASERAARGTGAFVLDAGGFLAMRGWGLLSVLLGPSGRGAPSWAVFKN